MMSENDRDRLGGGTGGQGFGARGTGQDPLGNALDGRDDPNRGLIDRAQNAMGGGMAGGSIGTSSLSSAGGSTGGSSRVASAVFDSEADAERAVAELRAAGVPDRAVSLIGRHGGRATETHADGSDAGETGKSVLAKAAAGSGIGALLGVAALAIPGVGPLAAAGAIAEAAVGGAALTGTAVGAAAGGLAGLLSKHGVSDEDARYYEGRINEGGTFVSVDPSAAGVSAEAVQDILYRSGGHSSSRARTA